MGNAPPNPHTPLDPNQTEIAERGQPPQALPEKPVKKGNRKKRKRTSPPPPEDSESDRSDSESEGPLQSGTLHEPEQERKVKVPLACLVCGKVLMANAVPTDEYEVVVGRCNVPVIDYEEEGFPSLPKSEHYIRKVREHYIACHNGKHLPTNIAFRETTGLKKAVDNANVLLRDFHYVLKQNTVSKWIARNKKEEFAEIRAKAFSKEQQDEQYYKLVRSYVEGSYMVPNHIAETLYGFNC